MGGNSDNMGLGELLEQRDKLDAILKKKFIKTITVMFTDITGSSSLTETKGDLTVRLLIKRHNDILLPLIEKNRGLLVKTIGDGTLSYFEIAQNAVQAAVQIQRNISENNKKHKDNIPINIKVGLHTGPGIVEHDDIFGDVVNIASRFVSLAKPEEICLSEDTYSALTNKDDIRCRFVKTTRLKGKTKAYRIYKAFWDETELPEELPLGEPSLLLKKGTITKKIIPIAQEDILIGRSKQCDIVLNEPDISRRHARLCFENNNYFIEDLKSSTGVAVNGKPISGKQVLETEDEITLGSTCLIFVLSYPEEELSGSFDDKATITQNEKPTLSSPTEYKLVILLDKKKPAEYIITGDGLIIGRLETNHVFLNDNKASRSHSRVWREDDKIFIEDLGSKNGTYLEGKRITKAEVLEEQEIKIGSSSMYVIDANKKFFPSFLPK